jgi:hypothetical protein
MRVRSWHEDQPEVAAPPLVDHHRGSSAPAGRDETTRLPNRWEPGGPLPQRSSVHDDLDSGSVPEAVRFGWWRLQCCPVGKHWSIVTPVKETELSEEEKLAASEHKDIRLP